MCTYHFSVYMPTHIPLELDPLEKVLLEDLRANSVFAHKVIGSIGSKIGSRFIS